LKIAFIAQPLDDLPSRTGSSLAIWVDELARRFVTLGNDVRVYCAPSANCQESDFAGYDIERVSTSFDEQVETGLGIVERRLRWMDQANREFYNRNYYYSWPYYFMYANSAARAVRAFNPDWVILLNFSQFIPVFRFWNKKTRILLMMQCDWLVELPYRSTRRRLSSADAIGGCSRHIAEGIKTRFPEYASKCHTVYNASDPDRFNGSGLASDLVAKLQAEHDLHGKRVVLFVGRMAPEKGVHVLLEAMAAVLKKHPNTVLLLAGNVSKQPPSPKWTFDADPEFENFAELNHDYGAVLDDLGKKLGRSVKFLGHVNHYELPSLYSLADLFVHPAIWDEPFGMIITEAMSCGTTVISTNVGGIPEIIENSVTGLLARRGSVDDLAIAINKLLDDGELRNQLGRNGRERTRTTFTWKKTTSSLQNVLRG